MENLKQIRWKQRYQNFNKAFNLLDKYTDAAIESYTELEQAGVIQLFETAFELSWKLLKDYLEAEGYTVMSPREAIKKAFEIGIIKDGELWLEALDDRNLTSHTYDAKQAEAAVKRIAECYAPIMGMLNHYFHGKLREVKEL